MMPFIRSLSELMAITESRYSQKDVSKNDEIHSSEVNSCQKIICGRSRNKTEVKLPHLPKIIRRKWKINKKYLSRFIDELDYNNQIQSSYDLNLIEMQNKRNQQDVA